MRPNPFVEEGVRARFEDRIAFRSYLVYLTVLALTLFLWWPRDSVELVLRTHSTPGTFPAVAISMFICIAYLQTRYGLDGFTSQQSIALREYVALTPVRLGSIVAGKLGFAAAHTAFLLLLGAPFLLASLAVSGVGGVSALHALVVIGVPVFTWRLFALLLLVLFERRPFIRDLVLLATGGLFLILTFVLAPSLNPILQLLTVSSSEPQGAIRFAGVSLPFFGVSIIIDVAVALACGAALLVDLSVVRRSARNRGPIPT